MSNEQIGWLEEFITNVIQSKQCTEIYCTTCGAWDFRRGLLQAASHASGLSPATRMDNSIAGAIIDSPTLIQEKRGGNWLSALQLILFLLDQAVAAPRLDVLLQGSWGGKVLADMRDHHRKITERHREQEDLENPINVAARHETKRLDRQHKHSERLEKKKQRDLVWLQKSKI